METNKIKKVLIALDYDPTAQKVAETGFSLAKAMGAEITLLHVISDPVVYTSPGHITIMGFAGCTDTVPIQIESEDALKNASQQFLDHAKQHLGDETVQTLIGKGDSAEAILNAAIELHAEIIVMGSHSRKWLENIVMGSVTEKVLHHSLIPLFIIPTKKNTL